MTSEPRPASSSAFCELSEQALELHRRGRDAEGLALAEQAQELAGKLALPPTQRTAQGFNDLGITWFETGYARRAKAADRKSVV